MKKTKILFAASEADPFAKTGGLADVAASLPKALHESDCDVRVIIPKYRNIPQCYVERMESLGHIYVPVSWRRQYCGIFKLEQDGVL
ncbi:MAG: glycogen/starch synthase, partial [Clostridiaceae bacterium]|nr:glycogen/starch synthase [Clostridiaceae bacterium]